MARTIARFLAEGLRGERNCGLEEHADVKIDGDRFTAQCVVEYGFICKCHNDWVPDIQEFDVRGRFEGGAAIVEKISRGDRALVGSQSAPHPGQA